jgi:hypothetical protein
MFQFSIILLILYIAATEAVRLPISSTVYGRTNLKENRNSFAKTLAAALPGDPIITGGLAQGMVSAVGLYTNVILVR